MPVELWPIALPSGERDETVVLHVLRPCEMRDVLTQPASVAACSESGDLVHRLTPRQLEVLRLLAEGSSTEAIAQRLCISKATVRNHVEMLLGRLGVHSRLEAVSLARREGLV